MPIGSAKIGVLGAGLVPGGSQTFNASGTFTVPPGVKKVNITGKGGTGNPGNAGNSGNAGNPGTGGGAGAGGSFFQNQVKTYNLGGTGGFALKAVFPNGLFGTNTPNQCFSFLQNQPASCWPNKVPTAILQQTAYGSGRVTCTPNTPVNGSYGPRNVCAQPGSSGNAGTAGNAGNPGNAGNSSSGICKTFPGGAGGNAGAGGAAGNGGSGGNAGGNGGHWDQRNPGSAGNSAGAGGAGLSATFPATRRGYAGGGGGGAGITTAGASGRNSTGCPTSVCFSCLLRFARGGDSCMSAPLGPPTYLPGFNNQAFPNPPNAAPTNMVGGLGGAGNASNGLTAIAQNTGQLSIFNVNMACGNRISCGSFNPTPLRPQLFRAGGGGGGGGTGFQTGPGSCVINTGAGGGGGGRGLVGNCGGVSPTPSGSAATPQTFNCVSVTPGSSYPITVASPGGQIVISWNPQ